MKIISIKEEHLLSIKERREYIKKYIKHCRQRRLEVTSVGATTVAPHLKKVVNLVAAGVVRILAKGPYQKKVTGLKNIPDGPVIIAGCHQGILDGYVWIPELPKHVIIVHGEETRKILLYLQYIIGLIRVTKNKDNPMRRQSAKLDMISCLLRGHSIAIFPETAWNLSPNKLHLPLNYGFIDVAKKSGAPIVPMTIHYVYDSFSTTERVLKIHIHYSKPIYVKPDDDLSEKCREYSDAISTTKWKIYESEGIHKRSDTSNYEYINFLKGNYKNLIFGGIDIIRERLGIHNSHDDFYRFFHINDHPFDKNGNLLSKY